MSDSSHPCSRTPTQLSELGPGDHLCCIYESEEQHRAVVTPFMKRGLEADERVLYIVDERSPETILGYLSAEGVPVERHLAEGKLVLLSPEESSLRDGRFSPEAMIDLLRSETERALADGYAALRVTGEMTWVTRGAPGSDRLIEYEARLNEFFPGSRALAICQYDRRKFDAEVLLDVLRTHPVAVLGTEVVANHFYLPPEVVLERGEGPARVDAWIQSLEHSARQQRQLEQLLDDRSAKLASTEARYRALFEYINEGFALHEILLDEAGAPYDYRYLDMNPAFCRLTGLDADSVIGRTVRELLPGTEDDPADWIGRFGHVALTGEEFVCEEPSVVLGRWFRVHAFRPAPLQFAVTFTDVTERRSAEQATADALELQRRIAFVSPVGIGAYRASGACIFANERLAEIVGGTLDAVLAQNFRELDSWKVSGLLEAAQRALGGSELERIEFGTASTFGARLRLDCRLVGFDLSGERHLLLVADDVSEQRADQERLRQTLEDLGTSNRELQQFAYVASHDLQEPLRMVGSFLQLLERKYGDQLDDSAKRYIYYAVDGAQRMKRLIADLLAFSRVGTRGAEPVPVAADEVLDETLANLGRKITETGAVIVREPLPVVLADRSQLGQLLQNVLGNALKFTGDAPPRVEIRAERDGAMWRFCVRDNGIGLDMQYAERIFVVFQRLHLREDYEGTGIGLAICKKIVDRHGGRIWVESEPGGGATFLFTLRSA